MYIIKMKLINANYLSIIIKIINKTLQILHPYDFDLQDLIPFLKFSRLGILVNDNNRICQSLFPIKLTVSVSYVVVLTTRKSVSDPF